MSPRPADSADTNRERGFVLAVVIFAVAALSIAGTALFLVVQSENAMANAGAGSSSAYHLANAGLSRYMGASFGEPAAEVTYEMGPGSVTVTATRLVSLGDTADVYIIRSEAVVADPRVPELVARRIVQQFARLRRRPFNPVAALTLSTSSVESHSQTVIDGVDACSGPAIYGLGSLATLNQSGSISSDTTFDSASQMLAATNAEWAALTDTAFVFDFQDSWPGWGFGFSAPADSFPTIRFARDVTVGGWLPPSGRGLLVVDGKLTIDTRMLPWNWDGVILAGSIEFRNNAQANINGVVLTGFEGTQGAVSQNGLKNIRIRYNSCNVLNASQGIALFSPIPNTWWESAE